jgi:hypothetical protein
LKSGLALVVDERLLDRLVDFDPAGLRVVLALVDDQVRLVLALDARSGQARDAPDDLGAVAEVDAERPVREPGLAAAGVEELAGQAGRRGCGPSIADRSAADRWISSGVVSRRFCECRRKVCVKRLGLDRLRLARRSRAGVAAVVDWCLRWRRSRGTTAIGSRGSANTPEYSWLVGIRPTAVRSP